MNVKNTSSSILKAAAALTLALGLQACVVTTDDTSLTVDNQSDYEIYQVYVAPVNSPSWGPDLLNGDVLLPGESLDVFDLRCDDYDVLITDELGAECELLGIDMCFDSTYWVIDNALLATCPIFR